MIPSDGTHRTQPPDRPPGSQWETCEAHRPVSSTNEILLDGGNLAKENEEVVLPSTKQEKEDMAKVKNPIMVGDFSGDVAQKPREEDWMMDEKELESQPQPVTMSYKEALKLKTRSLQNDDQEIWSDEDWDSNLVGSNEAVMKEGINITNSEI